MSGLQHFGLLYYSSQSLTLEGKTQQFLISFTLILFNKTLSLKHLDTNKIQERIIDLPTGLQSIY